MRTNTKVIDELISRFADDREIIDVIRGALETFERYHGAIYALEVRRNMYALGALSAEEYRDQVPALDGARTAAHNAVIAKVNILNRLAKQAGLEPFYDGMVSEDRPYRRQVADAVLEYVGSVIENRA